MYEGAWPPRKIVWCATTGISSGSGGSGPPVFVFGSALLREQPVNGFGSP
jgi:hypothetical protein